MNGYHEHDFTDYFQLLKGDGRWRMLLRLWLNGLQARNECLWIGYHQL